MAGIGSIVSTTVWSNILWYGTYLRCHGRWGLPTGCMIPTQHHRKISAKFVHFLPCALYIFSLVHLIFYFLQLIDEVNIIFVIQGIYARLWKN